MLPSAPTNTNNEYCSKCGGTCCSRFPGMTHPDQFGPKGPTRFKNMLEAVESEDYDIDVYEENGESWDDWIKTYYLRPSSKKSNRPIGSEPCKFQGENGCELNHEHRPYECQTLTPSINNGEYSCHHPDGNKQNLIDAWKNEQGTLAMIKRRIGL